MVTTDINEYSEAVDALQQSAASAVANRSPDDFGLVEQQVLRLEAMVRDLHHAMWTREARQAVRRLEDGATLTGEDIAVIRAFLICDAEQAAAHEASFTGWVDELTGLLDDAAVRVTNLDRDNIPALRGVLRDAGRLLPDIRKYLEARQRIEHFESSLQTLDASAREMLADILRERISGQRA